MKRSAATVSPTLFAVALVWAFTNSSLASPVTDIITADARRFTAMLASPAPEYRVEGLQGLADLKYWPAESAVLPLLDDRSPEVRRAAVLALGRLGGPRSIPHFIQLLDDSSWELRRSTWLNLCTMTAQHFAAEDKSQWEKWWASSGVDEKQRALLGIAQAPPTLTAHGTNAAANHAAFIPSAPGRRGRPRPGNAPPAHPARRDALRALSRLATASCEEALLNLLQEAQSPPLDVDEGKFVCEALERAGSARAIPTLAAQRSDAAAWALGHIAGIDAERALLGFPITLPVLLALDRLHSTNAGPFVPHLVAQMGQITYRSQPDDVMNDDLQPIQRVGVNLILRSGLAPMFIECVMQELEGTMKPPVAHGAQPPCPAEWNEMFKRMRPELKPGFVREDGVTTSQPIVAMCYLLGDGAALAETDVASLPDSKLRQRLVTLLDHPAVVPRVYVALALGRMRAHEALPALTKIIDEGYAFSDSTALASGKHFDQSQAVRWRGFLCMALGRMGGEGARLALERYASDAGQPRDIRYGSVIGLRFIGSPKSVPVLEQIARDDLIWMVRDEARLSAERISLLGETHVAKP